MSSVISGKVSNKFIFLPDGWNDAWVSAKAASGSTPAQIAFLGDSYTQGMVSSNWYTKAWPVLVRNFILNSYPLYADFWGVTESASFVTFAGTTIAGTPPFVVNVAAN